MQKALFLLTLLSAACGRDPGNGTPCDGPEDCLSGLTCVQWPAGDPGRCMHTCEDCDDQSSCITEPPALFCLPPPDDAP